jgi:cell division protein FtsQ
MTRRRGKRRRRGNGSLYITVTVALMLFVAIMGVSVFFNVSEIIVEGTRAYTSEQVIEASGIQLDESIFFLRESSAAVRIKETLSYVEEVRIVRSLPGTVKIIVSESFPVAYIKTSDAAWVIDENAKILEKLGTGVKTSAFEIYGLTPILPTVGETLSLGDSGSVQLVYLKQVLSGIMSAGIYKDVGWLDMSNISSITFYYQGLYTVNLGKGENLSDKLSLMKSMVDDHPDTSATIDLSKDGEGHFIKK